MENSSGSYFSSWPASEGYGFAAASVESFAGEGSLPPSGYFMNARSDHNLEFNEHEQNSTFWNFNNCKGVETNRDRKEFVSSGLPSFATIQESNLAAGGFKTQKQEQNEVFDAPIPNFVARNQMAVTATQTLIPPKMPLLTSENKSECPVSHPSAVQTQTNSANVNGVGVKPRVRARRGQATDPHSIAERLRREKISDRMKNLQDLVPNSNKADKGSMLDEIIDYVKFLQLQVKVLSMSRLGAPGAVLPLLSESQTESFSGQPRTGATAEGLLNAQDSEDTLAFEQEVVKLMETSITSAMQYLQNKGLCLMPVALASVVSNQKGMDTAAIAPQR
ncbi:hypothetical protein PR202_ga17876 [Eleusine coracana subsp. coracana]|uniref:BHLH domain-containing protein n=1 Tax=Eleusine coracana subsp. coracana TaxID=191504 RepID=A0AAV5CR92_ELECO|nr:hypothetical protein PR202_ga17876 [Eleusine coracana subsp. coracana]